MDTSLILQLVQIAISLAQSQLDSKDATSILVGIVQKGVQAYETHTGQPLDKDLIKAEDPV